MDVNGGGFESLSSIQPNIRRLDPFWATRLWQRLIREALMTVRVCRQRHFLKSYDEVFNGEDLVNSVLQFLKGCKSELDVERIDRSNALKVCQILIEKKLFESVSPKHNQKFEDGSNRLYRFIPEQTAEENDFKEIGEEKENNNLKPVIIEEEKENVGSPNRTDFSRLSFDSSPLTPEITRCVPFGLRRSLRLKTPLLRVRDTKPSPVRFSKRRYRDLDQEAVISQREKALALLLQLVDVPLLENILTIPYDLPELPEAPQPYILENDFTPCKPRPTKLHIRGLLAGIPSLKMALLCLDSKHPEGITAVRTVQECKILCYKSVVERFSCSAESLIPGEYFSICVAIVQMLKNEQRARALNALQLLMFHLPWKRRDQLKHLLQYLYLVVDDIFVSVDKKVTNYEAIKRDFLSVVLKHPLLAEDSQKILFDYLLLESAVIFRTSFLLEKIKETDAIFLKKTSPENIEETTAEYTNQCLIELASFVVDSTNIKLAEKKVWLKKFKKHHPLTYEDCKFDE